MHDKGWHLRPDTESDEILYRGIIDDDYSFWNERASRQVINSGKHEIRNWYCILSSKPELDMQLTQSDFVAADVFNPNKVFALFE